MTHGNRIVTYWVMALLTFLLAGCGFHLRGAPDLPFQSIYIDLPKNSSLYVELVRNIRAGGTSIALSAEPAEAVLQVISNSRDRKILTLNSDGRVREYSLYQHFTFTVKGKDNRIFVPPSTITLERDITYNEQSDLSKQMEVEVIYQEMQTDIVQRILRLIAESKNTLSTEPTEQ